MYKLFIVLFLCLNYLLAWADNKPFATLLVINGAISPASADYFHRGLDTSIEQGAKLVIIQLDTPGGLDKSMRNIIKDILSSPIPIVTFVAPSGARAASAGTFILYASHIAAMAPGTNVGAATPVTIGGGLTLPGSEEKNKKPDAMMNKALNDAIAYIKGLAELRKRNLNWAEKAVREGASLPAEEALQLNVINLIADDVPDLLKKINGKQIAVSGQIITLNTASLPVNLIEPDWRVRLLAVITDPSIAYILLLLGIYGLFFEFMSPGYIAPGVIGAISLLLALYALQLLPINYAGLALIFLGIAFFAAEAFMPSGALAIGGVIAFVAGSILLIEPSAVGFHINLALILAMAIINIIFFVVMIRMILKTRRKQIVSGREELIGMIGIAEDDFQGEGWVFVHSERWQANSAVPVKKGAKIRVRTINGLVLEVEPI